MNNKSIEKLKSRSSDVISKVLAGPEDKNARIARNWKIVGGLVLTEVILVSALGINYYNNINEAKEHTAKQLEHYSQKDLSMLYEEQGIEPTNVYKRTITDFDGEDPFAIARNMRAKDVGVVAQEIFGQLDGDINPGDVVIIPLDQLNPPQRRLV